MAQVRDNLINYQDPNYELNFTEININQWFDDAEKKCFDLFENTIIEQNVLEEEQKNNLKSTEEQKMPALDTEHMDEMERMLFLEYQKSLNKNKEVVSKYKTDSTKIDELREKIHDQFLQYKKDCENMDVSLYVNKYGNAKYNDLSHIEDDNDNKERINSRKFNIATLDIQYVTSLSDVTLYWKEMQYKYNYIAVAALVALGKPTHNAFQERVFSRGTYTDTKLKKRMTEKSFEMSVLNAVNSKCMLALKETIGDINNNIDRDLTFKKKMMKMRDELKEYIKISQRNESLEVIVPQINVDTSIELFDDESTVVDDDEKSDLNILDDESESDYEEGDIDEYFDEFKNTEEEDLQDEIAYAIEEADAKEARGKTHVASLPESTGEE